LEGVPEDVKSRRRLLIHYNQGMEIPERIVKSAELKRNSGDRGTPKWIAYDGVVYDVTDCPRWRYDLHEHLHFPGQDLSGELDGAPHSETVFARPCVRVIGRLAEN
jgi:predicted heme/steroid binding protein